MATAENAKLQYEGGQTVYPMSEMTNSGDSTTYTSSASYWSGKSGFKPNVKPNGLATGGAVTPGSSNDTIDVASLTCYLAGVKTTVSGSTGVSITRPATNVARINSVTITSAGAIAVIAGTSAADTTFLETRGTAGGAPYIPVGSIEIAQIRMTSSTAAIVTSAEIYSVLGLHVERYDFPIWDEISSAGSVEFNDALPAIHTGDLPKKVYASYSEPVFSDIALAADFVAPETTHSQNSTQVYGGNIGSSTQSLNQGSFTAYLRNGVDDTLVGLKNETLWFRFYPDKYETQHIMTQGALGLSRTFPAGDSIQASCTISALEEPLEIIG